MNTVRFEYADDENEIVNYMRDPWNEIDSVDFIVFRLPVGYDVYRADGSRYAHYETFEELCEEFIGNECCM